MRILSRVALLTGTLLGGVASLLPAQQPDAVVTPRGMIGLHAGGTYTRFSSRFGGTTGGSTEEPLGAPFSVLLTSETFPLLPALQGGLNAFLAASDASGTAGFRASPTNLTLGRADIDYGVDRTTAPFGLSVGILPRVSVEALIPVTSASVSVRSITLTGGLLGLNPDATRNETLLRRAAQAAGDAALGAIGKSAWLPVAGSPLGEELQRRVLALTGDTVQLRLPSAPLNGTALQSAAVTEALGEPGLGSTTEEWRLGDAEVGARVQLLGGPATGGPASLQSGVALRVAAGAAARLPTGSRQELGSLLAVPAITGHGGVSGNAAADLFLSKWIWATVAGRYETIFAADVTQRVTPAGQPFAGAAARTVRRTPGNVLRIDVVPRVRINEVISIGGEYSYLSRGEETFEDVGPLPASLISASVLNTPSRSAQLVGAGVRYSTLSTHFGGGGAVPVDVSLRYLTAISGSGGAPVEHVLQLQGSVYIRAWGSR
jgi:hypothetical protein